MPYRPEISLAGVICKRLQALHERTLKPGQRSREFQRPMTSEKPKSHTS